MLVEPLLDKRALAVGQVGTEKRFCVDRRPEA